MEPVNRLECYKKYERVRQSGRFNMITEANYAAIAAGLSLEEYMFVIKNYNKLKEQYENERKSR